METAAGIGILVALFIGLLAYQSWLRSSVRPRDLRTTLPVEEVKRLFAEKVAGLGWKIIDDDNPMVAQSGLLGGRRQEISMRLTPVDGGVHIHLWVSRLWTKGLARVPYKAHTIRMRMNAFERAVSASRSMGGMSPTMPVPGAPPMSPPVAGGVAPPLPVPPVGAMPVSPVPPVGAMPVSPVPPVGAMPVSPVPPVGAMPPPVHPTLPPPAVAPMLPDPTAVAAPGCSTPPVPLASSDEGGGPAPWWADHVVADNRPGPTLGPPASAPPQMPPAPSAQVPVSTPPGSVSPPMPPGPVLAPAPVHPPADQLPPPARLLPPPMSSAGPTDPVLPAPTVAASTGASPLVALVDGQRAGFEGVSFTYTAGIPNIVSSSAGSAGTSTFHWQWLLIGDAALIGSAEPREFPAGFLIGNLGERIHVLVLPSGDSDPVLYQVGGGDGISVGMGQLSFKAGFRRRKDIGVACKLSDDLLIKAFSVNTVDSDGAAQEESMELFVGWMKLIVS